MELHWYVLSIVLTFCVLLLAKAVIDLKEKINEIETSIEKTATNVIYECIVYVTKNEQLNAEILETRLGFTHRTWQMPLYNENKLVSKHLGCSFDKEYLLEQAKEIYNGEQIVSKDNLTIDNYYFNIVLKASKNDIEILYYYIPSTTKANNLIKKMKGE